VDAAAEALRRDLRRTVVRAKGTLEVNEGWRSMPYLAAGSAGLGPAIDEYLARRDDERFAEAAGRILLTCQSTMYILPGLFSGRSVILLYLAGRSADPRTDPAVHKQIRNLAWHVLPFADGLAIPGTGLLRLSMDLGTGTAGMLLALGSVLRDQPVHLPLLAPSRRTGAADLTAPAPAGAGR
jgi:predicted Kef-type K+ transport protein